MDTSDDTHERLTKADTEQTSLIENADSIPAAFYEMFQMIVVTQKAVATTAPYYEYDTK